MSKTIRSAGSAAFAFSLTAGLVALLASQPAAARNIVVTAPIEAASEQVSTAGIDLAGANGAAKLKNRVFEASRRVCTTSPLSLAAGGDASCIQAAGKRAAPQVAKLVGEARRLAASGQSSEILATISVSASTRG